MEGETPEREIDFDFHVSEEAGAAVYANIVSIWFSPYEFGLEWGLTEAAEAEDPDDPTSPLRIPVSVVARLRVPTGLIFDVLRALNQAMTRYEAIFGEIRRPEAR
jgi:hypothetical protein